MDSPNTLLLGFSFSMHPDGSPGSYNIAIADAMWKRIAKHRSNGVKVLLAAQWEIADALVSNHDKHLFDDKTFTFVAEPPKFKSSDVLDAAGLVRLLRDPKTEGAEQLSKRLCESLRQVGYIVESNGEKADSDAKLLDCARLTADQLAIYLNRLLSDRKMYLEFRSKVELHNLHRKEKGALGFEARQMPKPSGELLEFQTIRVNRLIIEAVIPDEHVLKRSIYQNTQHVLDEMLDHFKDDKVSRIKDVRVFGFHAHSPRCCRLTIDSFWKKGNSLEPENVKDDSVDSEWDPTTAQMWCRSCRNHGDYDKM